MVFNKIFVQTQIKENIKSSASLAFVRAIHQWPVGSPHKEPVMQKMFPFDDVIMWCWSANYYIGPIVYK